MQPIWLYEDKILDGRNRFRACQEVGATMEFKEYTGVDPIGFVISLNKERRHLSSSQLATVAVNLLPLFEEEAKKRQLSGLKQFSNSESTVSQKFEQREIEENENKSITKAAESVGTNRQYVADSKKLKESAPDVFNAVNEGRLNIPQAKALLSMPKERQEKVISEIKEVEDADKFIKSVISEEKKKKIEDRKQEILGITNLEISENKPEIRLCSAVDFLNTFEDKSCDLLITDPPYSTDVDDIDSFVDEWVDLALSKLKDTARAYICIGAYPKELNAYISKLLSQDRFILDNPLIWTYRNTLGITPKNKYNLNYQVIFAFIYQRLTRA